MDSLFDDRLLISSLLFIYPNYHHFHFFPSLSFPFLLFFHFPSRSNLLPLLTPANQQPTNKPQHSRPLAQAKYSQNSFTTTAGAYPYQHHHYRYNDNNTPIQNDRKSCSHRIRKLVNTSSSSSVTHFILSGLSSRLVDQDNDRHVQFSAVIDRDWKDINANWRLEKERHENVRRRSHQHQKKEWTGKFTTIEHGGMNEWYRLNANHEMHLTFFVGDQQLPRSLVATCRSLTISRTRSRCGSLRSKSTARTWPKSSTPSTRTSSKSRFFFYCFFAKATMRETRTLPRTKAIVDTNEGIQDCGIGHMGTTKKNKGGQAHRSMTTWFVAETLFPFFVGQNNRKVDWDITSILCIRINTRQHNKPSCRLRRLDQLFFLAG